MILGRVIYSLRHRDTDIGKIRFIEDTSLVVLITSLTQEVKTNLTYGESLSLCFWPFSSAYTCLSCLYLFTFFSYSIFYFILILILITIVYSQSSEYYYSSSEKEASPSRACLSTLI